MSADALDQVLSQDRLGMTVTDDGVCILEINQPKRRNALTLAMWQGLRQLFARAAEEAHVRSVILTGKGGHFCSGADITEFDSVRYDSRSAAYYDAENDRTVTAIRDFPKPVIAAMSGAAVGGGLSLALACDFRVADPTLRAGIPAARLGIVYSLVDCALLHAKLGSTRAKEILLTGRLFDLDDARRLGLVDRIADKANGARDAALAFAEEFKISAPLSVRGHKVIFQALDAGQVEERRQELELLIEAAFDSEDYREARRAFAERRDPVFEGR